MVENTNILLLTGKVLSVNESYKYEKETFFEVHVEVDRLSDSKDILPVIISKKLLYRNEIHEGDYITLQGEVRMINRTENGRHNIYAFGFANDCDIIDEETYNMITDKNYVQLEGFVCKPPRHRKTSLTGRYITDLLVACNRKNKKSFYIPVISWGLNSKMASKFVVGDKITIEGRFQSRRYRKETLNGEYNEYSIQEVSAIDIQIAEEVQEEDKKANIA